MRRLRRERSSVGAVFLLTGTVFGSWAARIPAVQEQVGLSSGQLGLALIALMLGAFAGLPLAGVLIVRLGSRRLLAGSMFVFAAMLVLAALSPSLAVLAGVLGMFGASNSGIDVAMNTQGAHVEHGYARPILSSLHAMFSAGALLAAGAAALLAAAGVPVTVHFAATAALAAVVGISAVAGMTDETASPRSSRGLVLPTRALLLPGGVAFCMVFAEDVANTWSAVYLHSVAETGAGLAAAGFGTYAAGTLAGRLVADRVTAARGPAFTLKAGGLVAAGGMTLAIAFPRPAPAIAGLLLLGLGLAPVLPVVYSIVAALDPANAGPAVAAVTTVGYLGSVTGPGSVGALAEVIGLRGSMALVPLLLVIMVCLAATIRHGSTPETGAR